MDFIDETNKEALKQILVIARERSKIFELLRSAIMNDDMDKIVQYSKELCGLENARN